MIAAWELDSYLSYRNQLCTRSQDDSFNINDNIESSYDLKESRSQDGTLNTYDDEQPQSSIDLNGSHFKDDKFYNHDIGNPKSSYYINEPRSQDVTFSSSDIGTLQSSSELQERSQAGTFKNNYIEIPQSSYELKELRSQDDVFNNNAIGNPLSSSDLDDHSFQDGQLNNSDTEKSQRTFDLTSSHSYDGIDNDKETSRRNLDVEAPRSQVDTLYINDTGNPEKSPDLNDPGKLCDKYPPKAIVFGVSKCGSGPLRMFLNAHPDIYNAPVRVFEGGSEKSVNYFDVHYKKGLSWYLSQMPCSGPDSVVIDHTIQYFKKSFVPKRAYMFNRNVKLILLVREPISRTVSQYLQSTEAHSPRGERYGDFDEFVLDESGETIDPLKFGVSASSYIIHLRNWLEVFPLDQFLIIDLLELAKQPLKPLQKLEQFLGVSSYFDEDNVYFNKTRGFYCVKVYNKGVVKAVKCPQSTKGREHPQISDRTFNLLKDYFDPLNEQFFKTIGKEFNWTTIKRDTETQPQ